MADFFAELFASGRAIDLVLLVMLVEALVLMARRRGDPVSILLAILPGALILLALRAALVGADWPMIALLLVASGVVHGAYIARRRW